MTSELLKYLKEQLGVFLKEWIFKKTLLHNVIFYQILMLFKCLKIFYVPF